MANLSGGFFGGISAGWAAQDELRKQQALQAERDRQFAWDQYKEGNDMAVSAMEKARPILEGLETAGPEEMPSLIRQMEHFVKIYGPELAPDEFTSGYYGDVVSREEAEASTPAVDLTVGSVIKRGDPRAGAQKLLGKGRAGTAVTPEDLAGLQRLRQIEVNNKIGQMQIKRMFGSAAAQNIYQFNQGGYQRALMTLQQYAQERGISTSEAFKNPEVVQAAKNQIYEWGDLVGAKKADINDLVKRIDDQAKMVADGRAAEDARMMDYSGELRSWLNANFGVDPSMGATINQLDIGKQALYHGIDLMGHRLIHKGEMSWPEIADQLHIMANRAADNIYQVDEDGNLVLTDDVDFDSAWAILGIEPSIYEGQLVDPGAGPEVQAMQRARYRIQDGNDGNWYYMNENDTVLEVFTDPALQANLYENAMQFETLMKEVNEQIIADQQKRAEAMESQRKAAQKAKSKTKPVAKQQRLGVLGAEQYQPSFGGVLK